MTLTIFGAHTIHCARYLLPKNQDADISQVTHAEGTDHVAGGIKPE